MCGSQDDTHTQTTVNVCKEPAGFWYELEMLGKKNEKIFLPKGSQRSGVNSWSGSETEEEHDRFIPELHLSHVLHWYRV